MSVKLTDVVPKFTGDSSVDKVDILEWIKKVELVARLQKVENLADFIPLFLEQDAFAIYDQLPDSDKGDAKKLVAALQCSFSKTPFQAFEAFKKRSLKTTESPDAFLADLRRLACLFGAEVDNLIACQFISGMPADVAAQLKALKEGSQDLDKLLPCAKQILHERGGEAFDNGEAPGIVGAAARKVCCGDQKEPPASENGGPPGGDQTGAAGRNVRASPGNSGSGRFTGKCYGCDRPGHVQRECRVICYRCKRRGHLERKCRETAAAGFQEQSGQSGIRDGGDSGNGNGGLPGAEWAASRYPMGY